MVIHSHPCSCKNFYTNHNNSSEMNLYIYLPVPQDQVHANKHKHMVQRWSPARTSRSVNATYSFSKFCLSLSKFCGWEMACLPTIYPASLVSVISSTSSCIKPISFLIKQCEKECLTTNSICNLQIQSTSNMEISGSLNVVFCEKFISRLYLRILTKN